jgi:hypothetical protein
MKRIATLTILAFIALATRATGQAGSPESDSTVQTPASADKRLTLKVALATLADFASLRLWESPLCVGPTAASSTQNPTNIGEVLAEDFIRFFRGRESLVGHYVAAQMSPNKTPTAPTSTHEIVTSIDSQSDTDIDEMFDPMARQHLEPITCTSEVELDAGDLGMRAATLIQALIRWRQAVLCGYSQQKQSAAREAVEQERRNVRKCVDAVPHVFPRQRVYTGDVELGREFHDNPIKAEERFLGKTIVVIGRVFAIAHPPNRGFLIEVMPGYPAEQRSLSCELAKRSQKVAATLQRNGLAILSGTLQQDGRRQLWLRNCSVEYTFSEPGEVVARSTERCLGELFDPLRTTMRGTQEDFGPYKLRVMSETTNHRIDCHNPIIVLSFACEMGGDVGNSLLRLKESCERHEFRDIRNQMLAGSEDGKEKTRLELGKEIAEPKRDRSELYREMVRRGRIREQEP